MILISALSCLPLRLFAAADASIEPADSYRLLLNGQELPLFTDKEVELPADAGNASVRLTVDPDKKFTYGGVNLSYPRYFTFEADLSDPAMELWSLSGNKAVLMIQRYPVEMNHRTMAEQLLPSFGVENTTLSDCEIVLDQKKSAGSRVVTTIGDGTISQEIYSFKLASGSLLLILQDTLAANGSASSESIKFREQLSKTFKILK